MLVNNSLFPICNTFVTERRPDFPASPRRENELKPGEQTRGFLTGAQGAHGNVRVRSGDLGVVKLTVPKQCNKSEQEAGSKVHKHQSFSCSLFINPKSLKNNILKVLLTGADIMHCKKQTVN